MKIAILGFGAEGGAALKFMRRSPKYKDAVFTILDKKRGKNYLKHLANFDLIVKSPGIPFSLPEIQRALKLGKKFTSTTELFFSAVGGSSSGGQNAKGLIIGVTGTKGKGTTSTLIYKILKAAKKDAHIAGNIGKPAVEILRKLKKNSISVLELSSFQLQNLRRSPHIAAVLDIFPDHLDTHKSFREYVEAKANIAKWQKSGDKIFFIGKNPHTRRIALLSRGKKRPVDTHRFVKGLAPKMPGAHNLKNASIAAAVTESLGISEKIIKNVIKNFTGLEHRLELARRMGEVSFWNDSGGTNPETAAAAIRSFKEAKILIAGGKDKGLDYAPLAKTLKHSNTKLVILIGENRRKIAKAIRHSGVPIRFAANLDAAVRSAYRAALLLPTTHYPLHTSVLFSPGSASFDMFKNYKERGLAFKRIVKKLK